ncbi:MAG TPA: bifunctional precorrin-2 dehydrogenase/sirohydrochlorin ferrochelatase [Bryobacteraceae bacterium]|nr:bifunctional precorrin-2 dehydrogenase/sirohydrochlorin ferrochelatase [Bryobacteraceae bacterium]
MNFRYPVFLDVAEKRCLVTGEGPEIPVKVRMLVERGAEVVYVHPTADSAIERLAREGRITWYAREFQAGDLDGCFLVISAGPYNSKIFKLAERRNVLCNAADDPDYCRFSFGSVVERGNLRIAVSTNGAAPALAVRLREKLEKDIGAEYGLFTEMLGELRAEIAATIPDFGKRRELWYRLVDSEALALIRQGRPEEARRLLRKLVDESRARAGE